MFNKKIGKDSKTDNIAALKAALKEASAVVIGAGAGLSTSAGLTYSGERFKKYFFDFVEKYGITDMYSGGFYPFEDRETFWGWWSRHIYVNRYMKAPKNVYEKLLDLVCDKDYFVLTTNVDHCFQRAGFDKKRLFYTQGDYGLFQCSVPCHKATYDNEKSVREMVEAQLFTIGENGELFVKEGVEPKMRIPSELIPRCPVCGKPMTVNLRSDNTFVEDEGWQKHAEYYSEFIRRHRDQKLLFLELGVGANTPTIIKVPFMQMTYAWEGAKYACINFGEAFAPDAIKAKSICIDGDIGETLGELMLP